MQQSPIFQVVTKWAFIKWFNETVNRTIQTTTVEEGLWGQKNSSNRSIVCYELYAESLDRSAVADYSAFNSESLQHTTQPGML